MDLSTVLPGILLLGIVIFFHELGHFLAAKWRGVTVLKFSLGMGPEMVGFTAGGTRYCFSWIPLGGFVQMAGDSPNEDGTMPEGGQEQFLTHHWFGRLIIAIAGPAANLVTAYFVMTAMCLNGLTQPDWPNVLGPVADTTAAWTAGLREGDVVTKVDGTAVTTWHDIEVAAEARAPRTRRCTSRSRGRTARWRSPCPHRRSSARSATSCRSRACPSSAPCSRACPPIAAACAKATRSSPWTASRCATSWTSVRACTARWTRPCSSRSSAKAGTSTSRSRR
ncbi:MAG: site-2 protease family protein [Candidatus Eisenbacteria bacterium]|nr:site-2 protease family protein [Candidatus Eisenbacteria bacterium]